jgi:glycosyl-4,4'-diaponeurosporenoate acyltransferase
VTPAAVLAADFLGWPVLQLSIAWAMTRAPAAWFACDGGVRVSAGEARFYQRVLRVRAWKNRLPDGAAWVGGNFRKELRGREPEHVRRFVAETRRAEAAHWIMFSCFVLFWPWNPTWARLVMLGYAAAANVPCIVVQRFNRAALLKLMERQRRAAMLVRA